VIVNRNHPLPAFTLVEVLIVITISCFFVVMVYASVYFFLHVYIRNKMEQQAAGIIWKLEGSLLHEIETSQILFGSTRDSLLICIMPCGDTIRYKIHMKHLIRKQGLCTDTLVSCAEWSCTFAGRPVESGITDHIELKIGYRKSHQMLQFDKTYTPEEIFNHADTFNRSDK
jgi:hypothetical protein